MKRKFALGVVGILLIMHAAAQNKDSIQLRNQLKEEIKQELKEEFQQNAAKNIVGNETFISKVKELISDRVKVSGTGAMRVEEDWDQRRYDPAHTPAHYNDHDRFWGRYNFYLNVDAKLTEAFSVHSTIRTGNMQYSFVNFGGNTEERFDIILGELTVNYQKGPFRAAIGRMKTIWTNQQGTQFDIPTHDGIMAGALFHLNDKTTWDNKVAFYDEQYRNNTGLDGQGRLYGFETNLKGGTDAIGYGIHTGMQIANSLPNRYINAGGDAVTAPVYDDGDLASDYTIWNSGGELTFKKLKKLSLNVDVYQNLRDYNSNPNSCMITPNSSTGFTPDFTKQKFGFVATVSVGGLTNPKDWLVAFSYLYMQKYAAMDYFAQYDWARWASTNIKGPEFKLGYRLNKYMTTVARLYITEEIKGLNGNDPDYTRSGNRCRWDLNFNF